VGEEKSSPISRGEYSFKRLKGKKGVSSRASRMSEKCRTRARGKGRSAGC